MSILYSEIFEEFAKAETKTERIKILQKYDHPRFRDFFKLLFDEKIQFDVEIPDYRPAPEPAGLNYTYLDSEMGKMYRFIKNHPRRTNVQPSRLKTILLVVLESLHKDESEILVKLISRQLKIKFLTQRLVEEAYPGFII